MEPIFGLYLVDTGWNRQAILLKVKEVLNLSFKDVKQLIDSSEPLIASARYLYEYHFEVTYSIFQKLDCKLQLRIIKNNKLQIVSDREEYRVYSALLHEAFSDLESEPPIILDYTTNNIFGYAVSYEGWLEHNYKSFCSEDLCEDFQEKCHSRFRLERNSDLRGRYFFLSEVLREHALQLCSTKERGYLKLDSKIIRWSEVSRVGFNTDYTKAAVTLTRYSLRHPERTIYFFEQQNKEWRLHEAQSFGEW